LKTGDHLPVHLLEIIEFFVLLEIFQEFIVVLAIKTQRARCVPLLAPVLNIALHKERCPVKPCIHRPSFRFEARTRPCESCAPRYNF